ncbi:MAG: hypothetical protein FD180_2772 [Planctomycetota bacterium]|nr:MAG: hypothetical protein FD180_2772 [Planctomycetota bacterium]
MRTAALLGLFLVSALSTSADDVESRLAAIVKRLDAEDAAERDAASSDLQRWCDEAGERARRLLEVASAGAPAEARARISERLDALAELAKQREFLDSLFKPFDLPSVVGLKFVEFNSGQFQEWEDDNKSIVFGVRTGWVVQESETEITFLGFELKRQVIPRKREYPPEWDTLKARCKNPEIPPGDYRELDFAKYCRKCLSEDFRMRYFDRVGAALLTHWAAQRGDPVLCREMFDNAVQSARYSHWDRREEEPAPEYKIASGIAQQLRTEAVHSAYAGETHKSLFERWRQIASMPENHLSNEARAMMSHYESLLSEDDAFEEVEPAAVEALLPGAQVRYWIHKLRDVRETHSMSPGSASVFGDWGFHEGRLTDEKQKHPAYELVKLGDRAVGALIDQLDDDRPTRVMSWHRASGDAVHLMSLAGASRQIVEKITGVDVWRLPGASEGETDEERASNQKAKAGKWWSDLVSQPAQERAVSLLSLNPGRAARSLMALNAERNLPLLMKWATENPEGCLPVLQTIEPQLGPAQAAELKSLLSSPSDAVATEAARTLWDRCDSDAGVAAVVERLSAGGQSSFHNSWTDEGVELLARVPSTAAREGLASLIGQGSAGIRQQAMAAAGKWPDQATARALVEALDDTTETGWSCSSGGDSYRPRYCDHAAMALEDLAGASDGQDASRYGARPDEARIQRVKEWWKENSESLDWKALREKR